MTLRAAISARRTGRRSAALRTRRSAGRSPPRRRERRSRSGCAGSASGSRAGRSGCPTAAEMNLIGVGRRDARVDLVRMRDVLGLRRLAEQIGDLLVQHRAARDHRAHSQLDAPDPAHVAARVVGGRRDVDRDRDVRLEPVRRRLGAVEADLLLDGGDGDDVDLCSRAPRRPDAPTRGRCTRRGGCRAPSRADGCSAARPADRTTHPGRRPEPGPPLLRGSSRRCPGAGRRARAAAGRGPAPAAPACRETAPGTRPLRVSNSKRCPWRVSAAMPPSSVKREQAVVLDVRDGDADLVDVADDRERRRIALPARTRANDEPSVSEVTSANGAAASRQTLAGSSSWPDGPGSGQERGEELGRRHRLAH